MNLPESDISRDYYIVLLLDNLANSEYVSKCVFKGGTSHSKCYLESINRFSEDIDLTFLSDGLSNNHCGRNTKKIEYIMTDDSIRKIFESMHNDLLYTNDKQNFDDAIRTFEEIDDIFKFIEE